MKKQEELRGLLKEVFSTELGSAMEAADTKAEARAKVLEDANAELTARIDAIEATPARQVNVNVPGEDKPVELIYRGKALDTQGKDLLTIKDDDKREAYAKWMIDCVQGKAAMQEGTDSEGGYLVPIEYENEIMAYSLLSSFALADCRVWNMGTDNLKIPSELTKVSVAWTAEEAGITQTEPTFAEVDLVAKRLDGYSIASNEFLADEQSDIVSYLTGIFGEAIGQELDNQVLTGTGDPVSGVMTAAAGYSVVLGSGSTTWADMIGDNFSEVISKLPINRVRGAKWYLHRNVLHVVRTLKDTANNYIFQKMGEGRTPSIWEYPYLLSEEATGAEGASACAAVFGNMKHFAIGRRKGDWSLEVDPFGAFTTYQTRFRVVTRWGLAVGLGGGFSRLVLAGS